MTGKTKKITVLIALVLFTVSGWALLFQDRQDRTISSDPSQLIRLHILANSDSDEDQRIKLQVRDAVNAYMAPMLSKAPTAAAARQIVAEERENILRIAQATVLENGVDYPVSLQTGWFDFPLRSYGTFVLPAGRYEAVRILIGEGRGQNWWCVLFPPLCFVDATGAVAVPASDKSLTAPERKVELRWKIVELWEGKHDQ